MVQLCFPKVRHSFLCENDQQKVQYLKQAFPDADHIFEDMVEVSKGRAKDLKLDGKFTTVPEVWQVWQTSLF